MNNNTEDFPGYGMPVVNGEFIDMNDSNIEILKKEINNLIWCNASDELTLAEAEERACTILNVIRKAPTKWEQTL